MDKEKNKDIITLPRFSNHSLRHTFTTRMYEAGDNIKVMQDILGHADADAETALSIYSLATKDLKRAELNNFDDYFNIKKLNQGYDHFTTDLRLFIKNYAGLYNRL